MERGGWVFWLFSLSQQGSSGGVILKKTTIMLKLVLTTSNTPILRFRLTTGLNPVDPVHPDRGGLLRLMPLSSMLGLVPVVCALFLVTLEDKIGQGLGLAWQNSLWAKAAVVGIFPPPRSGDGSSGGAGTGVREVVRRASIDGGGAGGGGPVGGSGSTTSCGDHGHTDAFGGRRWSKDPAAMM